VRGQRKLTIEAVISLRREKEKGRLQQMGYCHQPLRRYVIDIDIVFIIIVDFVYQVRDLFRQRLGSKTKEIGL